MLAYFKIFLIENLLASETNASMQVLRTRVLRKIVECVDLYKDLYRQEWFDQ